MASIRLRRERTPWADRARSYKVSVDGEPAGSIRFGEEKVFEVSGGSRRVQLHIDWASSRPLEVDVAEGVEAALICRGRSPLLALYWMTVKYDQYIVLERDAGG